MYVACAQLLPGPVTPHQIHHTQHIGPLAGTVAHRCSPGSLATICASAFREQFGPPGSFRRAISACGMQGSQTKPPTFRSLCHLGRDLHQKIDAAFMDVGINVPTGWASTARHSCSLVGLEVNAVGCNVGRNMRQYNDNNNAITIHTDALHLFHRAAWIAPHLWMISALIRATLDPFEQPHVACYSHTGGF